MAVALCYPAAVETQATNAARREFLARVRQINLNALTRLSADLDRQMFATAPLYARLPPPPPVAWWRRRLWWPVRTYLLGWRLAAAALGRAMVGRPVWPDNEGEDY